LPENDLFFFQMTDGKMADGKMADGKMADGKMTDGKMAMPSLIQDNARFT
jgi:hypothetical protein